MPNSSKSADQRNVRKDRDPHHAEVRQDAVIPPHNWPKEHLYRHHGDLRKYAWRIRRQHALYQENAENANVPPPDRPSGRSATDKSFSAFVPRQNQSGLSLFFHLLHHFPVP